MIDDCFYDRAFEQMKTLIDKGNLSAWESYYIGKNGKIIPVEQTMFYLYDKQGDRTGVVTINRDISESPETALKTIQGGRLSGMTDISPMWRYQAITEQCGPCGIGWKYEIKRLWIEDGTEGQKVAFAEVSVFVAINFIYKDEPPRWSDPIPGIGGSMLVNKESAGLRTSDEAFKMAVTDPLSVSLKMLGFGADIYMGMWDGSKYKDYPKQEEPTGKKPEQKAEQGHNGIEMLCSADSLEHLEDLYGSLVDRDLPSVKAAYSNLSLIFKSDKEGLHNVWKEMWASLGEEGCTKYEGAKNRRKKALLRIRADNQYPN